MPKHTIYTDLGSFSLEDVPGKGGKDLRIVFSPAMLRSLDEDGVILSTNAAHATALLIMDCMEDTGE